MPSEDEAARRQRSARDTARWRSRRRRAVELYQVECGPHEIDLAIQHGGLRESRISDKAAVNAALGRLLRKALTLLVREEGRQKL